MEIGANETGEFEETTSVTFQDNVMGRTRMEVSVPQREDSQESVIEPPEDSESEGEAVEEDDEVVFSSQENGANSNVTNNAAIVVNVQCEQGRMKKGKGKGKGKGKNSRD